MIATHSLSMVYETFNINFSQCNVDAPDHERKF